MQIPNNVKLKKFPWTVLPIFSKFTANAIYPNIYIPRKTYENLQSKNPNLKNVSILIHEQTHIKRQRKMGWLLWGLKYCFSKKFRFNEEFVAIKESMKFFKKKGGKWDTKRSAKFLSSYLYLWCVSYSNAKQELDKAWEKI